MSDDWTRDPVGSAGRGENPTVLLRMKSGFAVYNTSQFIPGYCLLLSYPKAPSLEGTGRGARRQFLEDMGLLGEAVADACRPRRVNYSIYGNTDPYLHAHVVPRYEWEPEDRIKRPIWEYPASVWNDPCYAFDAKKHGELIERIKAALARIVSE